MRSFSWIIATALLGLLLAVPARAGRVFQYDFGADQYNVPPGESVDVQVFLVETLTDGDVGNSWLASEQLSSAAVRISYLGDTVPTNAASMPNPPEPNIFGDRQFNDPASPYKYWPGKPDTGGSTQPEDIPDDIPGLTPIAGLSELRDLASPVGVSPQVVTAGEKYRVRLGVFRFVAGPEWYVSTPIQATDLLLDLDETVTFTTGRVLDLDILPGNTLIVTIPEPATLALAFGAILMGGAFRFFRRRSRG